MQRPESNIAAYLRQRPIIIGREDVRAIVTCRPVIAGAWVEERIHGVAVGIDRIQSFAERVRDSEIDSVTIPLLQSALQRMIIRGGGKFVQHDIAEALVRAQEIRRQRAAGGGIFVLRMEPDESRPERNRVDVALPVHVAPERARARNFAHHGVPDLLIDRQ